MPSKWHISYPLVFLLYIILCQHSFHLYRFLGRATCGILHVERSLQFRLQPMSLTSCESDAANQILVLRDHFAVNETSRLTKHRLLSNGGSKDVEEKTDERVEEPQQEEQKEKQEEQKIEKEPVQVEQQQIDQRTPRRSRIETYDEFARFRDSSRPPDSHYPPGPVGGFKRSHSSVSFVSQELTCIITGALIALFYE